MTKSEIYKRLGVAMLTGDRISARDLYFMHILPCKEFGNAEADRLSYRVGAIDEGDKFVAGRNDL